MGTVYPVGRGEYKIGYSGAQDDGTSTRAAMKQSIEGLSIGGGVRVEISGYVVHVDYALTQRDILDAVHRIKLSVGMK